MNVGQLKAWLATQPDDREVFFARPDDEDNVVADFDLCVEKVCQWGNFEDGGGQLVLMPDEMKDMLIKDGVNPGSITHHRMAVIISIDD